MKDESYSTNPIQLRTAAGCINVVTLQVRERNDLTRKVKEV